MAVEQRVRELELRMDALVGRLDGVEATVERLPQSSGAPERLSFAPPQAKGPAAPAPAPSARSSSAPTPRMRPSAAAPRPAATAAPVPPARAPQLPRFEELSGARSLEDLLGGRVLAWVGGLAVLIGLAFLFAVGVSRGWIGEGARTLIAGSGAVLLLGLGIWLHEQRGRTDAALAAVATGISALFITLTVGAQVYDVLPAPVALALALLVGGLATSLAVRWEAQGIAALGIAGGLVAPVLAGAPSDAGTMAILLVVAASAVGVLLRLRWDWLSFGVFLITVPQWAAYLAQGQPPYAVVAVLTGFGVVGAAAAVGYELRVGADSIRPSSAFLLSLNAIALAAAGWLSLSSGGDELPAKLWLVGLALVHVAIGLSATRSQRTSHAFGLLALVIGAVLANAAFAALVDGPIRALGWVGAGVALAGLIRRGKLAVKDEALTGLGLGAHVALALLQSITSDAPPALLDGGGTLGIGAAVSLAGVAAGCLVSARLAESGRRELRVGLDVVGLTVVAYLTALALDGAPLTLALAAEAVALAKLGSRTDDEVSVWACRGYLLLATIHALAIVAPPSVLVDGLASPLSGALALAAVATAAAACALLTTREQDIELRRALELTSMTIAAYLGGALLDGAVLVVALAGGAVTLAELARRFDAELVAGGALAYLGGALTHVLAFEAPPAALVGGLQDPVAAAIAVGAVVLAVVHCARSGGGPLPAGVREPLLGAAAVAVLYLASALVVTPFQPGSPGSQASLLDLDVRQQGQVLLSGLWSIAGLGALVFGLRRDLRLVRLGALALLLVSVGKVFLFDLATLTSIYRVASFIGLGLLLLMAAFAWQRMRPRALPDMREVPEGIR